MRSQTFGGTRSIDLSLTVSNSGGGSSPGQWLRGMVSPFLPAGFGTGLHAVVQLSWPAVGEDGGQSVAISLSPCESLLIPLRGFRRILHRYVRWSIPKVPLVELNAGGEMRLPPGREGGVTGHVSSLCKASQALARSSSKEQEI